MFAFAESFNRPLNFDTSNVTNMVAMFVLARVFDQPINFDTSKVTQMYGMFRGTASFNQDLSHLCVTNFTEAPANFDLEASAWVLPRPVWGTCPAH